MRSSRRAAGTALLALALLPVGDSAPAWADAAPGSSAVPAAPGPSAPDTIDPGFYARIGPDVADPGIYVRVGPDVVDPGIYVDVTQHPSSNRPGE